MGNASGSADRGSATFGWEDVALRQMAHRYPTQETGFMRIAGVGQTKLAEFGPAS
jgi:superfamily II DNA helicase RecQ